MSHAWNILFRQGLQESWNTQSNPHCTYVSRVTYQFQHDTKDGPAWGFQLIALPDEGPEELRKRHLQIVPLPFDVWSHFTHMTKKYKPQLQSLIITDHHWSLSLFRFWFHKTLLLGILTSPQRIRWLIKFCVVHAMLLSL